MSYRLYNRLGSGGFVVEAALKLTEAPFELVELDSKVSTPLAETFRETNPWKQVPVLILPDGSTMTETAAILIHLAACFPDKALAPSPGTTEHGKFLRWTVFTSVNLYEAVLRSVYPQRFTSDNTAIEATRSAAMERMGQAMTVLEKAIEPGPFLFDKTMSVADVYIAMMLVWYRGNTSPLRLITLKNRVKQNSIIAPIWRRHFGDA